MVGVDTLSSRLEASALGPKVPVGRRPGWLVKRLLRSGWLAQGVPSRSITGCRPDQLLEAKNHPLPMRPDLRKRRALM
ncbi:MAG: hypothetical protein WA988_20080, partial [Candidatus Nanopelagicales bacterium]